MTDLLYKDLVYNVVGAAMEVHKILGPGFSENVYQAALEGELSILDIPFVSQQHIQIIYKELVVADYYLDLVIDTKIVVELKAVDTLAKVHQSQVLSYLKASGLRLGLLMNFGESSLRFKRIIL
ncbi:MAG: GxxExxY protein [Anaerolineae bacterium]|nr:GxxExxY protein [Anaerolineae bacterium]